MQKAITDKIKEDVARAMRQSGGNASEAARIMGIPRATIQSRLRIMGGWKEFEVDEVIEEIDIDDLLKRRKTQYSH